jgi:uncharacterized protein YaiE (UPF0345 family)
MTNRTTEEKSKSHIQHNVYFGGTVQSLGFSADGEYTTVGVITSGEYRFTTDYPERTTITSGTLNVRLPGEAWKPFRVGESFSVAAGVEFDLRVDADVGYLCEFEGRTFPSD